MEKTDVLIVGAGPTGLSVACQLAVRGVKFRIIDAAPGPQTGSRGKGLQPRTLEVFDDLGIVSEIVANGIRLHVQQLNPVSAAARTQPPVVFLHGLGMDNMASLISYQKTHLHPFV